MIVITDCMECPKIGKCVAWTKLTPKQKFTLKTGVGIGKFILKDCPLDDFSDNSALVDACKTVVDGYESDGMENMQIRDEVFYKECKNALGYEVSSR